LFEDAFNYADQMSQSKGAGAVYLDIFHWGVEEFLDTKKINADEKSRLQTLSLGLIVPSKFFELAERGEDFYVFAPYSVYQAFGEHLDDMDLDRRYEELLAHPAVKKRPLSARAMLTRIAQTQFESGYPYLIYKSNANRAHPLKGLGQIKMSNLCTEIFQLQTTSIIGDYGAGDQIGYDISCNLGSLNIVNVMESKGLQESVHTAMDMLTAVSDLSDIRNAPGVRRANRAFHSVGLGAMNLHGYLAKNRIRYESEEARDFARSFFAAVNFYSIERSMQIARERGLTFEGFERSDYASGVYFEPYLEEDFRPRTEAVRRLFEGIALPTPADWARLRDEVRVHGLYHAYRLAIAPTASISYIQNATPSIAPIVDVVETRTYGNATTYYPAPFLSEETYWYYKSAYHINMYRLIDLVAEIQPHVDQGISTVLYVTSETSTRELARLYIYAWKKGLKSLYYTRTKNLSVEECISCAV
ncbi:MAG: ribonucleoside-diphosphate reductase subunit alpha, partial [Meiothermus sp.]|nr:ribonucleoside-diphosphate reductase subunit alpha [Meiothermus sp.]